MKILLLGEYSNVHWTLAKGLESLGHQVTVLSNGDFWKNYPRDINLVRRTSKIGGIIYLIKLYLLLPKLKNFDIVQLINPMFLEIKAERIFPIYKYLQKYNNKVILGGFGMDYYWVSTCCNNKPLRYSDFNIGSKLRNSKPAQIERTDWIGTNKQKLNIYIAKSCDGIITGLYEYWICYHNVFREKTTFIPFPINILQNPTRNDFDETGKIIKIFIGINKERSEYKGTDIMLQAAKAIHHKYADRTELRVAESIPFAEYQHLMEGSDVILDQLYSYTPSMNSLLAMSKGIIVVGGGEPENYEIIHETELRPIINVEPNYDSVYNALEHLIQNPEQIPDLKRQSIEYVRKHHDYIKVAKQYESFYKEILNNGPKKEI